MRKFIAVFCPIFTFLMGMNLAFAQDVGNKFSVGASALYYFPQEDVLFDSNVDVEDNIALGLNASYIVIPHFALELAWNRFETDIEAGRFKLSEITIMPLLLTAQFRILPSNPVVPYVGVGVGYYFNKLDKNREVKTETETSKTIVAEEVDDSLGLHVDGGVDWFLTDNFALNLDARYFWTEADITGKENLSSITDEIDLDSLVLGFGVKLYF